MTLLNSIILGLIQGLAEFLPISSSGHLAILEEIFGIKEAGMVFDVMLHLGTLIAIFFAFWTDIRKMIAEGFKIIGDCFINIYIFFKKLIKKDSDTEYLRIIRTGYRKFVMLIIVSTIPTALIGLLMKNIVDNASKSMLVIGICLLVTSVLLKVADMAGNGKKKVRQTRYSHAILIGVLQGIATLPGLSRSGTTMTAGLLCGFDRRYAVKYSFIMSIPAVLGAVVLEIKDFMELSVTRAEMIDYFVGTLVAAVVGYICIKTMLVIIRGKKFKYFSYYCVLIGAFSIIWYFV